MHLSAEQLDIASRIDAKVQRLASEGDDDVAIFVELVDDMPAFRRLLDAGPHAMDQLFLRFGGFYRYAKILEAVAAGIGVSALYETKVKTCVIPARGIQAFCNGKGDPLQPFL